MANLTFSELATLAQNAASKAGYSWRNGESANVMAAIALAESSGNPRAYNGVGRDNSYGLWQINMIGALGPSRRKQFGITSNESLYDPQVNADAMIKVLKAQGLRAWTTHTSGKYLQFMNASTVSNTTDTVSTANSIGFSFENFTESFVTQVQNLSVYGIAGLLLVIGAVIVLWKPTVNAATTVIGLKGKAAIVKKALK